MKFRRQLESSPEINLTPLIDVVFLLLIFFMVSTTFDKTSELKINLPEASAQQKPEENKALDLSIDAAGHFYLNGNEVGGVNITALMQALIRLDQDPSRQAVIVRADAKAPVQAMVTALDALAQMNWQRISLATLTNAQ